MWYVVVVSVPLLGVGWELIKLSPRRGGKVASKNLLNKNEMKPNFEQLDTPTA